MLLLYKNVFNIVSKAEAHGGSPSLRQYFSRRAGSTSNGCRVRNDIGGCIRFLAAFARSQGGAGLLWLCRILVWGCNLDMAAFAHFLWVAGNLWLPGSQVFGGLHLGSGCRDRNVSWGCRVAMAGGSHHSQGLQPLFGCSHGKHGVQVSCGCSHRSFGSHYLYGCLERTFVWGCRGCLAAANLFWAAFCTWLRFAHFLWGAEDLWLRFAHFHWVADILWLPNRTLFMVCR